MAGDAVSEPLERQVVRAQQRVDTVLGEHAERLGETTAFLHGVVDVLLAKGIISIEELTPAITNVRDEIQRRDEPDAALVILRSPAGASEPTVTVDCSARYPICKAACCKLDFALTVAELESGAVKWDLGRPYFIRHERDGYCTHAGREDHRCGIYENRPGICRAYSCANDTRIWKNFEAMELNREWLDENLRGDRDPVVRRVMMGGAA